jgi:CelD/BcsL family acetyltransferase involved in cellulose biosynthesis
MHAFDTASRPPANRQGAPVRMLATTSGSSLQFSLARNFNFLSREYAQLFARSSATAFQHPIWLHGVFTQLTADHEPAFMIARTQAEGKLMLVLPMIKRRFGIFSCYDAADLDVGDYAALVVDREAGADASRQIHEALSRLGLLRIRKVRGNDVGFAAGDMTTRSNVMSFHAHEVELTGPVDGWQARLLSADFARYLKSKGKRLAAKGKVTLEEVRQPALIKNAFESLREFRRSRWATDLLRDPAYFRFYQEAAIAGQASGFTRTYVLSVDGVTAAVLFGVWHRGRFSFLIMGFDNERFRNSSAGLLIIERVMEDCIHRKDEVFDLTIGDEEYKQRFGPKLIPMSVLWFGRRPWVALAPTAFAMALNARSRIRKLRSNKTG